MRFDSSYGGEDGVFSADALAAGYELVFDPRFHAFHDHARETYGELRRQQQRLAYGLARIGSIQREGVHKRDPRPACRCTTSRSCACSSSRAGSPTSPSSRAQFRRNLPRMVVAEWTLGSSALRYAIRRPPLRGTAEAKFR